MNRPNENCEIEAKNEWKKRMAEEIKNEEKIKMKINRVQAVDIDIEISPDSRYSPG